MLIKRMLKLYFRDKAAVFFSLMLVLIIFLLHIAFIGRMMAQGLEAMLGFSDPAIYATMSSLTLGGLIAISSMTTSLGALGTYVLDREKGTKDFLTSPVSRRSLTLSYIGGAGIIGFIMSCIALLIAIIYLTSTGLPFIGFANIGLLLIVTVLSVFCSSSLMFFLIQFIKTENAFSSFSAIIGSTMGFFMGIFIPIGNLPSPVQWFIRIFPPSHAATMYKQVFAGTQIDTLFYNAPVYQVTNFREFHGVDLVFDTHILGFWSSAAVLLLSGCLFFILSLIIVRNRKI